MTGKLLRKLKAAEDIAARCPYQLKVGMARCTVGLRFNRVIKADDGAELILIPSPLPSPQGEGWGEGLCSIGPQRTH